MQHLEEGEIHAWLDGALSEAEGARMEQHAATCKECAAMVADARGLIAGAARIVSALDHVPSGVIPKSGRVATPSRSLWRMLRLTPFRAAMAASLVVAAGSLIVVQRKDNVLMVPRAQEIALPMTAASTAVDSTPAPPAADKSQRADAPAANEMRPLAEDRRSSPQQSVSKTTLALTDTALLLKSADSTAVRAPAPKVASVVDERAKKERDAAVSSVAATAAPASAVAGGARSSARGGAAGQTAAREPARDSARADIAFRRALPLAMQRAEGAPNFTNLVGCYQLVDSASWPRALPLGFMIAPDSARVYLVRPNVDQRSAIGRWQNTGPQSAAITLDGSNTTSFTLTQIGPEVFATLASAPDSRMRVVRSSCAL